MENKMENIDINDVSLDDLLEKAPTKKNLSTGVYDAVVKYAYLTKSKANDDVLNLVLTIDGRPKNFTLYISYTGRNSPVKKENGVVKVMPGYLKLNALSILTTGKNIRDVELENKGISVHDFKANTDVIKEVPVYSELCGKSIRVGIEEVRVNKNVQVGNEWKPTTDLIEINEINNFYNDENRTATEVNKGTPANTYELFMRKEGVLRVVKPKTTPIAPITSPVASEGVKVASLFDSDDVTF